MKIILPLGILLIIALHIPARGEESYPILYRGEVTESGPRLLAHFENSFLRLAPTEQITHLRKIEKELKKPRLEPEIYPGLEEKERFKNLYSIITDRLDQIYYVVSGIKFYPIRAKGFHLIQDAADCRRILSVAIETEWVTFDSPEKTEAPPLLNLNRDQDGALIFSGRPFTPTDEFQQIKFQPIRYPKDLPEVLKELFKEETDFSDKRSRPALFFSAPRTGFLPLEVTLWSNLLSSDTALTFFMRETAFGIKSISRSSDRRTAVTLSGRLADSI